MGMQTPQHDEETGLHARQGGVYARRGSVSSQVEHTNMIHASGEQFPLTTPLATRLLWRAVMTHTSKFGNAVANGTVPEVCVCDHAMKSQVHVHTCVHLQMHLHEQVHGAP